MPEENIHVYRNISQMIIGEKGFTYPGALIIGTNGYKYIETSGTFSPYKEKRMALAIKRTGLGFGEYKLTHNKNTIYTARSHPLQDNYDGDISCTICPLGWNESKRNYLKRIMSKDFFSIDQYDLSGERLIEAEMAIEESNLLDVDPQAQTEYFFDMQIRIDKRKFPRTHKFRRDLKNFLKTGQFSRIRDTIDFIKNRGKGHNEELPQDHQKLLEKIIEQTSSDWIR